MMIQDGIPTEEDLATVMPDAARLKRGPVAITECFQNIPCNPCVAACAKQAITMEPDMNGLPHVNPDLCNGCGLCVSRCPGLAIFVVDQSFRETEALVKIPFEFTPVPEPGQLVCGLNRAGEEQGWFPVVRAVSGGKKNRTWVLSLKVPQELAMEVRNIRVGGYRNG